MNQSKTCKCPLMKSSLNSLLSEIRKKDDLVPKKHKFKFVLVSSLLAGSQKLTTRYNTEGSLLIFGLEACRRDVGCKVTIPSWVFRLCFIIKTFEVLHHCSLVTLAQYQTLQTLSSVIIFICPHTPTIHTDIDYCKQQRS